MYKGTTYHYLRYRRQLVTTKRPGLCKGDLPCLMLTWKHWMTVRNQLNQHLQRLSTIFIKPLFSSINSFKSSTMIHQPHSPSLSLLLLLVAGYIHVLSLFLLLVAAYIPAIVGSRPSFTSFPTAPSGCPSSAAPTNRCDRVAQMLIIQDWMSRW